MPPSQKGRKKTAKVWQAGYGLLPVVNVQENENHGHSLTNSLNILFCCVDVALSMNFCQYRMFITFKSKALAKNWITVFSTPIPGFGIGSAVFSKNNNKYHAFA